MLTSLTQLRGHARARARARAQRLRAQDGASTIEFLFTVVPVLLCMLIVVQLFIVFMHALTVNHAVAIGVQEVAARGGLDEAARRQVESYLPLHVRNQCPSSCVSWRMGNAAQGSLGAIQPGAEPTSRTDRITVSVTYMEDFYLLKPILAPMGVSPKVPITRSMTVASQSLHE